MPPTFGSAKLCKSGKDEAARPDSAPFASERGTKANPSPDVDPHLFDKPQAGDVAEIVSRLRALDLPWRHEAANLIESQAAEIIQLKSRIAELDDALYDKGPPELESF
jgi:hypothetical protein